MTWFHWLFPAAMLLWPAAFTLVLCGRAPAGDAAARALSRRMIVATIVALAIHVAVRAGLAVDAAAAVGPAAGVGGAVVPRAFGVAWTPFVATFGSMALWFWFAMPALVARQPGWRALPGPGDGARQPVRAASLQPRHRTGPVPRAAWIAGWVVFAACAAASAWAVARGTSPFLLLGLTFWLFAGLAGSRATLLEPEPLDAAGSPELRDAYARLRSFRAWAFFWFGLLGTATFSAVAVLAVLAPSASGLAGGILGSAFGLGGALFGTLASVRRARINTLRLRLSAGSAASGGPGASATR